LHKLTSAGVSAVEQVGFTQVSDDPVSIATVAVCGGDPIETRFSN
jgi:hypothetical protein